jgi:hypothetical protein
MRTGFYKLTSLTKEELKNFFSDANKLAYDSHVEKLDANTSFSREHTVDRSVSELINACDPKYHNICIDRSVQHPQYADYGEIGYSITGESPAYFLYIYLTLDSLDTLIKKYNLEERYL